MEDTEELGSIMVEYSSVIEDINSSEKKILTIARALQYVHGHLTEGRGDIRRGLKERNHDGSRSWRLTENGELDLGYNTPIPLDAIKQLHRALQQLSDAGDRKKTLDKALKRLGHDALIQ